jgi:hypothetical protein
MDLEASDREGRFGDELVEEGGDAERGGASGEAKTLCRTNASPPRACTAIMSPGCRTGAKLHLCGDAFSIADAQKLLRRAHGKSSKAGAWPISVCRAFPDPSSVGFISFFKAVPAPSITEPFAGSSCACLAIRPCPLLMGSAMMRMRRYSGPMRFAQ